MNIVVCVKRVPATDSVIKIAADGKSYDPAGLEFVLNPYDEFAVEEALKTRDAAGDGSTVTAVTFGDADAQKELRTCLALGCDSAVRIKAEGGPAHDAYSTAEILAAYIKSVPHDLVFVGKQAVDGDNNQMGPRLAALLGLPSVSEVSELSLEGGVFTAGRDIEGAREVVTCPTPCVISAHKGLNEPRSANLKGIMAAKKKPLEELDPAAIEPACTVEALTPPPERPPQKLFDSVDDLVAALKSEAKVL